MADARYQHVASLGRAYGLRWVNPGGAVTYPNVFSHRLPDDRFAVLYDPVVKDYLCVDMSKTLWWPDSLHLVMPDPQHFPTEDAAVMAARLQL